MTGRGQPAEDQKPGVFSYSKSDECSHPGGVSGIALRPWRPGDGEQRHGTNDGDVYRMQVRGVSRVRTLFAVIRAGTALLPGCA